jgi:hypothetical protein
MAKSLTVLSAQCIKPFSGTGQVDCTALCGSDQTGQSSACSAGWTIVGGEIIAVAGGSSTDSASQQGIEASLAGADKLYLTINGARLYPPGECINSNSQLTWQAECSMPLIGILSIGLQKSDATYSDGDLGSFTIGDHHKIGLFSYAIINYHEEIICQVMIRVADELFEQWPQASCGKPARSVARWDHRLDLEEEWEFFKLTQKATS